MREGLLYQNLKLFKGSFRLIGAHFFVRGTDPSIFCYFSYFATFGLLFQKLLECQVKTARYGISTGHRGAPRALTIGQHDREERASRTCLSRFRHRQLRHN